MQTKQEKAQEAIAKTNKSIAKQNEESRKHRALQAKIDNMPNPIKFVEQKNQWAELRNCVKNWERKIEIAEVAAKKARATIRQAGGYIDDGGMDNIDYN